MFCLSVMGPNEKPVVETRIFQQNEKILKEAALTGWFFIDEGALRVLT